MSDTRHLIGLLLGTEEDWPRAFETLVGRLAPIAGPDGCRHRVDVERITMEPFNLRDRPRYALVVDRLATGFQRAGHEVLLFTTGESTSPVPKAWVLEQAEGQRIGMCVPELRHVMAAYEAVEGYDIVHDHTMMGPPYSQLVPGLPVVTTIHGEFNAEMTEIYERVTRTVPLIAISHAQRRPAPHVPIARVIHHGLDAEDFPFDLGGEA